MPQMNPPRINIPARYSITTDGTTFYENDMLTGQTIFSATNFDTVFSDFSSRVGTGTSPTISSVILELGAGDFTSTTGIDLNRGRIKLKGQGGGLTRVILSASAANSTVLLKNTPSNTITNRDNLASNANVGDRTLTLSTTNGGYTQGAYILLRSALVIDTEIGSRYEGEIHKVRAWDSTNKIITLGTSGTWGGSVYNSNTTANTACVDNLTNFYTNVTIEGIEFYDAFNSIASTLSSCADNGGGLIRVTTSSAHGYTTGDSVFIIAANGTTNVNGTWTITVIDATRFDLVGSTFSGAGTTTANIITTRGALLLSGQTAWRFIDGLNIKDCNFHNMWYAAAEIWSCLNVKITGCTVRDIGQANNNNYYGFSIRGACNNVKIIKNDGSNSRHFVTMGAGGASGAWNSSNNFTLVGRFRNVTVKGNTSTDTIVAHFDAHQGGANINFVGNTCIGDDTSANGIQSRCPCTITGNTVQGITGSGISLDSGTTTTGIGASGSIVSSNIIDGCTTGIIIQGGVDRCLINANICKNIGGAGIITFATASVTAGDNCIISNNLIYGQTANTAGIYIDSSIGIQVIGNRIIGGTSTTGLRLNNTKATPTGGYFADNHLTAMGGTPFQFHASPSNTHIIKNNIGLSDSFTMSGIAVISGSDIMNTVGLSNIVTATTYTNRLTKKKIVMSGGTVTGCTINGKAVTYTDTLYLEIGDTFSLTFTGAPTTTWTHM